jgi:acetyltransferase-like isoleucine patch superfamily enzyme
MPIGAIERTVDLCSRIRTRLFTLLLSSQFKEMGAGSRIVPPFRFCGLRGISLGEGVIIHRDCWIHVVGDHNDNETPNIIIKSYAGIGMGATIAAAKRVVIGEFVLLARNVYISDHAHAYENIEVPIMYQGINRIAPVIIGNHTWLGQNVVVLPGVSIGEHCIIGANSVVNLSMPDYCVAVGVPARVVRQFNVNSTKWEKLKILQESF